MKSLKTLILTVLCGLFLCPAMTWAQDATTQGTEFWVSFMGNGFKDHPEQGTWLRIQLLVSAKNACSGTITNPQTGWTQPFEVGANSTLLIDDINQAQAYMEMSEHESVKNKGLLVTTTDTVSVYCANIATYSFDASYVMPTEGLADDYIIQTFDQSTSSDEHTSAFLIVATEDNTTIDITPTVKTLGNKPAGQEFSITLNRGQVYQVRSHNGWSGSRDLSGSRVTARDCKKIAVFNGNNLTKVPASGEDSDCVFEQAMPLKAWGKKFVVTASLGRENNDYVKVISAYDNNKIFKDGTVLATLNAGESKTFELSLNAKSCFIEAEQRCAVYLYNHSRDGNSIFGGMGAPSMVWIAPIEQRIDAITFSTFNYESTHETDINDHYMNVIVETADIGNVLYDGQPVPQSNFEPVAGNATYSFWRKKISDDTHHLSCANGLNAHVYGFGAARGYAYMVGSKASDLSTNLIINDVVVHNNDIFDYCIDEEITFAAEVNIQYSELTWDFGDGTTSHDNPAHHTYHDKAVYPATLIITTDESACEAAEVETTNFFIDVTQKYVTHQADACMNEYYSGYGFNNVLITDDTILSRLQPNPTNPSCSDSLLLYITAHPTYHKPVEGSRCWRGEPGIFDEYGFGFEYTAPGIFHDTLFLTTTHHGCDSIVTLTLKVADQITHEFSVDTCSNSYEWDGRTYTESDSYSWSYTAPGGCDSIVTLNLTLYHDTEIPTPEQRTACDSLEWYGNYYSETNLYTIKVPSPTGCDTIRHLDLTIHHTPSPRIAYASDSYFEDGDTLAVITNTEFFALNYDFFVEDTQGHINEWDTCIWRISKESWKINPFTKEDEPDRRYCKVHVAEHNDTPVELTCSIYDSHCLADSLVQRFYLKSSFFGVDDHETRTSLFSVLPNPNSGQMRLHFEQLEGKVELKVYDMRGILIDRFEHHCDPNGCTLDYDMKPGAEGLYFFICHHEGRIFAQKAIVIR